MANETARALRYRGARRVLSSIHRRPRLWAASVILMYGMVVLATAAFPWVDWGPWERSPDYYRDLQSVDFAILGAQSTLVGLVYPLVIALIGLLFEAKTSTGSGLRVYLAESEAFVVGATSLALAAAIALQAPAYGQLLTKVIGALTVVNTLWFLFNMMALGFFVARSLEFVRPASRQELTKSYIANTAWPVELRYAMTRHHWFKAAALGHLPAPDGDASTVFDIFGTDPVTVRRALRGKQVLVDVRMALLAAVLRHHPEKDAVTFRPLPGATYRDDVELAGGADQTLTRADRALIRLAFRFSPPAHSEAPPKSDTFLKEAASQLIGYFDSGKYEEFDARQDELIELHGLLYALAQDPTPAGQPLSSYAVVEPDLMRSIGWEWARAHFPLLQRVGDHLVADGRFFDACAHAPAQVLSRALKVAPFDAAAPVVNLSFVLYRALLDGAARRHAEVFAAPPPRDMVFTVAGVGSAFYRRAWVGFVGGWEAVGKALTSVPEGRKNDWRTLQGITAGLKRHLHDTALMVAVAAQAGERQAIGWSVDMLLKWRGKAGRTWQDGGHWALQRGRVTLALLGHPWEEVATLPLGLFQEAFTPSDVYDAATENLWLDTQVVLVCSLVGLFGDAAPNGRVQDGPAEAARRLFLNTAFDEGASDHPHNPPLSGDAVLRSVLRLVGAGGRFEDSYGGDVGDLADEILRIEGPSYVSARVYSWGGMADIFGQADPQLIVMAATAINLDPAQAGPVVLHDELKALLTPDDDRAARRVLDHLRQLLASAASVSAARGRALVATLRDTDVDAAEFAARVARVRVWLEACVAHITGVREAQIIALTIDPGRLEAVAQAAALTAFTAETGDFPVSLFKAVAQVTETLPEFRSVIGREPKGRYTDPQMEPLVSGERDWHAGRIRQLVGAVVMRDVTEARSATRRRPRSAAAYWTAVKAAAEAVRAASQTPILVRMDRNEPEWLEEWTYDHYPSATRPVDLVVTRASNAGPNYDYSLNDIPFYSSRGAGAASWVFGRETLERVEFQVFQNGEPVEASFEPDVADVWTGKLALKFGHRVTLGPGPLWRIAHPRPAPPAGSTLAVPARARATSRRRPLNRR